MAAPGVRHRLPSGAMRVDSFKFLPRSFRPLYEQPQPLPEEREPVWAELAPRLADARVALVTSAGLYVEGGQEPFDADGERADPGWGDPTWRPIPHDAPQGSLGMMHLHVRNDDVLADHEVALPLRGLAVLAEDGLVGSVAPTHYSVMGYQRAGLADWRERTAPEIVERLRDERVDGVVLAPV